MPAFALIGKPIQRNTGPQHNRRYASNRVSLQE